MEEWQKEIILTNLSDLLEWTNCSKAFLAIFQSRQILSPSDVSQINAQDGSFNQNAVMYDILKTRVNAFNILKEALDQTYQSGVLLRLTGGGSVTSVTIGSFSYDKLNVIGRGKYGVKIFRGKYRQKDVALKYIPCEEIDFGQTLHEIDQLIILDCHVNVVRTFAVEKCTGPFVYLIAANELGQMNLDKWLCTGKSIYPITPEILLFQIANGTHHLHENSITHRSLNPNNVLIFTNVRMGDVVAKISDAGISKTKLQSGANLLSIELDTVSDEGWISQEILAEITESGGRVHHSELDFTKPSDIFSMGCLFYYVLNEGDHPFGNKIKRNRNILQHKVNFLTNDSVHQYDLWKDLILRMVSHEADDRPSAAVTLDHPVFTQKHTDFVTWVDMEESRKEEMKIIREMGVPQAASATRERLVPNYRPHAQSGLPRTRQLIWNLDIEDETRLFREAFLMNKYGPHQNILYYHDYSVIEEQRIMKATVDSFDVTLVEWIRRGSNNRVDMIKHVTEGLHFLHDQKILHLNLLPVNLLRGCSMSGQFCLKISNFQNAEMAGDITKGARLNKSFKGTDGWIAPEVYDYFFPCSTNAGDIFVTYATDIFNLGLVIYYILTNGDHPFGELFDRRKNILKEYHLLGQPTHPINPSCSKLTDVLAAMISRSMNSRPTASDVKSYFSCFQW